MVGFCVLLLTLVSLMIVAIMDLGLFPLSGRHLDKLKKVVAFLAVASIPANIWDYRINKQEAESFNQEIVNLTKTNEILRKSISLLEQENSLLKTNYNILENQIG